MPTTDTIARAKEALVRLLIDKAPNWVSGLTVRSRLPEFDDETMTQAIISLVDSGRIAAGDPPRYAEDARYALRSYEGIPVRRSIRVGNVEVPRVISTSTVAFLPEDFNEAVERLAEYTAGMEIRFAELVRKEQHTYWTTIVTVFGVFVAILALVLVSLPKIEVGPSLDPWDIFRLNLAQISPVALVLAIFVAALRWLIR